MKGSVKFSDARKRRLICNTKTRLFKYIENFTPKN